MITGFTNRWTKLGNYSSCVVFYEGHAYQSAEHAYQAAKFEDEWLQKQVRDAAHPATAKKLARELTAKGYCRKDWHDIKNRVMLALLREKFSQEPEYGILRSTGQEDLEETNWWHDNYWGNCVCFNQDGKHPRCLEPGENWLGKLLMQVRAEHAAVED